MTKLSAFAFVMGLVFVTPARAQTTFANPSTPTISSSIVTTASLIASSATPALVATSGLQTITLTGPTTPTISGIAAGQRVTFQICQDSTGSRTWTWPASVKGGMTIGSTASTCSSQSFNSFNGTTLFAENLGVSNIAP